MKTSGSVKELDYNSASTILRNAEWRYGPYSQEMLQMPPLTSSVFADCLTADREESEEKYLIYSDLSYRWISWLLSVNLGICVICGLVIFLLLSVYVYLQLVVGLIAAILIVSYSYRLIFVRYKVGNVVIGYANRTEITVMDSKIRVEFVTRIVELYCDNYFKSTHGVIVEYQSPEGKSTEMFVLGPNISHLSHRCRLRFSLADALANVTDKKFERIRYSLNYY